MSELVKNQIPAKVFEKKKNIFFSMLQVSRHLGVPRSVLKKAQFLGCPGFHAHNRLDANLIEDFLNTHKIEIGDVPEEKADLDTLKHYKKEIAKRDVVLRDLQIAERKAELIDPKDIKNFLVQLGIILSSVIKKQRQELMSKCVGYEKVIDESTQEIFILINLEMEKWK